MAKVIVTLIKIDTSLICRVDIGKQLCCLVIYNSMKIESSCQPRTLGNTVKPGLRALGKQPFVSTLWGAYIRWGLTFGGYFVLVSSYQDL